MLTLQKHRRGSEAEERKRRDDGALSSAIVMTRRYGICPLIYWKNISLSRSLALFPVFLSLPGHGSESPEGGEEGWRDAGAEEKREGGRVRGVVGRREGRERGRVWEVMLKR